MARRNKTRQHVVVASSSVGHHVRAELGLTQAELAQLLSVSRTMLAKSEGDNRPLPAPAEMQLSQLLRLLLGQPPPADPPLPPPAVDQREQLALRLQGIALEEYPVRQRLARLRTRLAQLRRRQQLGAALLPPEASDHSRQMLGMLLREADELLALEATAPLLLELRLRLLALERAEIERLLSGETTTGQ